MRGKLAALEKNTMIRRLITAPDHEEIYCRTVAARTKLANEIDLRLIRNDAPFIAHIEELSNRLAAIISVVQGPLVDIHADEAVRHGGLQVTCELHRVFQRCFAVIECMLDTVAQSVGRDALDLGAQRPTNGVAA